MDVLLRRENEALIRVKDAVLEAGRLWERENPAFTYKGHLRGPGQPAKVYGGGREPGIDGVLANPENLLVDP